MLRAEVARLRAEREDTPSTLEDSTPLQRFISPFYALDMARSIRQGCLNRCSSLLELPEGNFSPRSHVLPNYEEACCLGTSAIHFAELGLGRDFPRYLAAGRKGRLLCRR